MLNIISKNTWRWFSVALMASCLTGCASMKKPASPSLLSSLSGTESKNTDAAFAQPARMAVIWRESAMGGGGQVAARGFGGRIYFYDENDEAIRADGHFVVYAFDESKGADGNGANVPERKYVFHQDDLQRHYSQTDLGHSYSVWLPWDEVGGVQTTVSLLPVFKPTDGQVVRAGQSLAVLPGKKMPEPLNEYASNDTRFGAQQVSHEGATGNDAVANAGHVSGGGQFEQPRQRATTINVSREMGRRLNSASPTRRSDAGSGNAKQGSQSSLHQDGQRRAPSDSNALASALLPRNDLGTGSAKKPKRQQGLFFPSQ